MVMQQAETKPDRRRRYADDPSRAVTVNLDIATIRRADAYVVENGGSRSGLIRRAVVEFLTRRERERSGSAIERVTDGDTGAVERAFDRVANGNVAGETEARKRQKEAPDGGRETARRA